jgi:hypothetical protein
MPGSGARKPLANIAARGSSDAAVNVSNLFAMAQPGGHTPVVGLGGGLLLQYSSRYLANALRASTCGTALQLLGIEKAGGGRTRRIMLQSYAMTVVISGASVIASAVSCRLRIAYRACGGRALRWLNTVNCRTSRFLATAWRRCGPQL